MTGHGDINDMTMHKNLMAKTSQILYYNTFFFLLASSDYSIRDSIVRSCCCCHFYIYSTLLRVLALLSYQHHDKYIYKYTKAICLLFFTWRRANTGQKGKKKNNEIYIHISIKIVNKSIWWEIDVSLSLSLSHIGWWERGILAGVLPRPSTLLLLLLLYFSWAANHY